MVTREQILETQRKCEEIRKKYKRRILNESEFNFNSIEEMSKYYDAIPLDEFDREFRNGN